MASILRQISALTPIILAKNTAFTSTVKSLRNFSHLSTISSLGKPPLTVQTITTANVLKTQVAGFKQKAILRKRCKDCYMVRREGRLFIICPTHPRHKQMKTVKDEKHTWILSHATQGKVRPW